MHLWWIILKEDELFLFDSGHKEVPGVTCTRASSGGFEGRRRWGEANILSRLTTWLHTEIWWGEAKATGLWLLLSCFVSNWSRITCDFITGCSRICPPGRECQVLSDGSTKQCVCLSRCKKKYKPVCGTDGKLYNNHCELHRTACKTEKKIRVDWDFKCFKKDYNREKGRLHDHLRHWIDLRILVFPLKKKRKWESAQVERSLSKFPRGKGGGGGAVKGIFGRVGPLKPSKPDPV